MHLLRKSKRLLCYLVICQFWLKHGICFCPNISTIIFSYWYRYDKFCPFYKSVWMMRNIIHFYNLANQVRVFFISFEDVVWFLLYSFSKGPLSYKMSENEVFFVLKFVECFTYYVCFCQVWIHNMWTAKGCSFTIRSSSLGLG